MKKFISLICLSLTILLAAGSLSGCHKQNEIAVTVEGVEVKTSTYICALIDADLQGRQKVYEEKSKADDFDSSKEIDYLSEKIDDKSFSDWVKETAMSLVKRYAYSKKLQSEKNVKFTETEEANIKSNASYNWSNYGGSFLYGPNGVSYDTYLDYYMTSMVSGSYFLSIYGKDGTDPVPESEVEKKFYDNFDIMHLLYFSATGTDGKSKDDADIEKAKKTLEEYAVSINSGKYTFKDVKKLWDLYNGTEESDTKEDSDTDDEDTDSTEDKPLDSTAQLIASSESGTNYSSPYFEKIHALGVNEATVIKDDNKNYYLFVRGDIKGDPYYLKNQYNNALSMIKYSDFSKQYEADANALTYTENKHATGIMSSKSIDYTQYDTYRSYYGSTAN